MLSAASAFRPGTEEKFEEMIRALNGCASLIVGVERQAKVAKLINHIEEE